MILTYAQLVCDQDDCTTAYAGTPAEARSIQRTKEAARREGWLRAGGRDYCPAHAVELVTAVRTLAGAGRSDPQIAEALGLTVFAVCWVRHRNEIRAALRPGGRARVGAS